MRIMAIDPGTEESGWCVLEGGQVRRSGVSRNAELLGNIVTIFRTCDVLAIEMIASYGMAVGREVFETCVWIGRFQQQWHRPTEVCMVYRRDVKLHLCGSAKAKDANIRQALLDLLGPQGTKKEPGPTYGVKSHAWAALGVAVTVAGITPESIRGAA
jgi:Holliday junction resolvasome RuvABC endonuclease subunit